MLGKFVPKDALTQELILWGPQNGPADSAEQTVEGFFSVMVGELCIGFMGPKLCGCCALGFQFRSGSSRRRI